MIGQLRSLVVLHTNTVRILPEHFVARLEAAHFLARRLTVRLRMTDQILCGIRFLIAMRDIVVIIVVVLVVIFVVLFLVVRVMFFDFQFPGLLGLVAANALEESVLNSELIEFYCYWNFLLNKKNT